MNAINQNPYSELIYQFMDGNTNSVQQKVLFDALADNQELQNEFQQAVEISKGFQIDKSVLAPSAQLTNKVFQAAGLSMPMQFAATNNASKSKISKFKTFSIPLASTLIGIILTSAFFLNFYTPSDNSQAGMNNQIAQTQLPINKTAIPIVKSEEKQNIVSHKQHIKTNNIENKQEFANNEILSNDLPTINYSNIVQSNNNNLPLIANHSFNSYQTNTDINNFTDTKTHILNLSLELKGMTGLAFFPQRAIQPESFSLTNNLAIGLMYKFDKHSSAGISLGRESLQMYSFDNIGGEYQFNLEPNLTWVGANYRYTGNEIYGSIYPYGELIAAGTKFGPMGKAIIGLNYNPENFFSMSLGLEGSSLMYRFMNKTKSTEKVSIVYNFGFHF